MFATLGPRLKVEMMFLLRVLHQIPCGLVILAACVFFSSPAIAQSSLDSQRTKPTFVPIPELRPLTAQALRRALAQQSLPVDGLSIAVEDRQVPRNDLDAALRRMIKAGDLQVSAIPSVNSKPDFSRLLISSFNKDWVSQTVGPGQAVNSLQRFYASSRLACGTNAQCLILVDQRFAGLGPALAGLNSVQSGCDEAAQKFGTLLQGIQQQGQLSEGQTALLSDRGVEFDRQCLAAPWDANLPAVARNVPAQGALEATAVLTVSTESRPFCTGVFLSPQRVLTAKHCFADQSKYRALASGQVVVRRMSAAAPADDSAKWIARAEQSLPASITNGGPITISDDWMLLKVEGGPSAVPQLIIQEPGALAQLFVPGFFFAHDVTRKPTMDPIEWLMVPDWWKGLRWSKPGMCLAVDSAPNCFRMLCQTTFGYSGAPVFSTQRDPQGRLVLHGIVKGTEGAQTTCLKPEISFSSLAVRPAGL